MTADETVEGSAPSEQAHDATAGLEEQERDIISENTRTGRRGEQGVNEESTDTKEKTEGEQERLRKGDEPVAQPLVEAIDALHLRDSIEGACVEEKTETKQDKLNKNKGEGKSKVRREEGRSIVVGENQAKQDTQKEKLATGEESETNENNESATVEEPESTQIDDSETGIKEGGQSTDTNAKKGGRKDGEMTGSLSSPDSSSSSTGAAADKNRGRGKEETKSDAMAAPDSNNQNPAGSCPTDGDPAPDLHDDAISTTVDICTPDGIEKRLTNYRLKLEELVPKMIDNRVIGARVTDIFKEIPLDVKRCDHQAVISSGLLPFISTHRNYFDAHPDYYSGFVMPFNSCLGWLRQVVRDAPKDAQPKPSGLSSQAQELENNNERSKTEEANSKKETSMLRDSTTERGTSSREISYVSSTDLM